MGWFSGLYRKVIVGSWNSPQAAMTARGPGTRKASGDDCLWGKGVICRACSPVYGWFLGCTQFRVTGCPGMPGRSTAGDCRGLRNHAPLAWDPKTGPAPLACADRSWPGSSVVDGWRAGR